ncbi:hypothetical protein VTO73DRAFT_11230 [Trametes versicolor]
MPSLCTFSRRAHGSASMCPPRFDAIRGGRPPVISTDFMGSNTTEITNMRVTPPSRILALRHWAGPLAADLSIVCAAHGTRAVCIPTTPAANRSRLAPNCADTRSTPRGQTARCGLWAPENWTAESMDQRLHAPRFTARSEKKKENIGSASINRTSPEHEDTRTATITRSAAMPLGGCTPVQFPAGVDPLLLPQIEELTRHGDVWTPPAVLDRPNSTDRLAVVLDSKRRQQRAVHGAETIYTEESRTSDRPAGHIRLEDETVCASVGDVALRCTGLASVVVDAAKHAHATAGAGFDTRAAGRAQRHLHRDHGVTYTRELDNFPAGCSRAAHRGAHQSGPHLGTHTPLPPPGLSAPSPARTHPLSPAAALAPTSESRGPHNCPGSHRDVSDGVCALRMRLTSALGRVIAYRDPPCTPSGQAPGKWTRPCMAGHRANAEHTHAFPRMLESSN